MQIILVRARKFQYVGWGPKPVSPDFLFASLFLLFILSPERLNPFFRQITTTGYPNAPQYKRREKQLHEKPAVQKLPVHQAILQRQAEQLQLRLQPQKQHPWQ
jgi:hypothetical protein